MAKQEPVTIVDVAKRAGVSATTVSRMLNGDDAFRDETKDKIHQAIRDLKYVPLRRHRKKKAGGSSGGQETGVRKLAFLCLINDENEAVQFTDSVVAEVRRQMEGAGGSLDVHRIVLDRDLPDLRKVLGEAEGVLLRMPNQDTEVNKIHEWLRGVPVVQVLGNNVGEALYFDHVVPDVVQRGAMAASCLVRQGAKRLVFAHTHQVMEFELKMVKAFFQIGKLSGIETSVYMTGDRDEKSRLQDLYKDDALNCYVLEDWNQMLKAIAEESEVPFGLFMSRYFRFGMAISGLEVRGLVSGRDFFPIGSITDRTMIEPIVPEPAMMYANLPHLASRAIQQLTHRIEHPHDPLVRISVAPSLLLP